jgi:diketogulonate reductase-like aldo/keto reductase
MVTTSAPVPAPVILYGTAWKEGDTQRCVYDALRAGFTGIDTANQRKHYYEEGVGKALVEWIVAGKARREDLFLQSKFTHIDGQDQRLPYDPRADISTQVRQSFTSTLQHFHTEYLDSFILHGPKYRSGVSDDDWAVWRVMEELQQSGKVRHIGLSNVGLDQVSEINEKAKVRPSFVQNRCYAIRGWDRAVRKYCSASGIVYQGFSLLTANSEYLTRPAVRQIAKNHAITCEQLVFAFARSVGMLPLTGTRDPLHMSQDLQAVTLQLGEQDLKTIDHIAEL